MLFVHSFLSTINLHCLRFEVMVKWNDHLELGVELCFLQKIHMTETIEVNTTYLWFYVSGTSIVCTGHTAKLV